MNGYTGYWKCSDFATSHKGNKSTEHMTHRWAILRSAIPMNVSIQKTVALVLCLAKLHNYCIVADDNVVLPCTASDEWQHEINGAVPMVETEHSDSGGGITPRQLLEGGHHFDDIGGITGRYNRQRRYNYVCENQGVTQPRDRLHDLVASVGLTRPSLQVRSSVQNNL